MERTLNYIRDILRKEGLTGPDSINHCIVLLVCRLLDDDMCERLDLDKKFAFNRIWFNEDGTRLGDQEFSDKVYDRSPDSLIGKIITKLGFGSFKFKLKGNTNRIYAFEKLAELDVDELHEKCDIIGTVYEYHLKTGTSSAMRDLGQYYTNRQVINYMVKLCDPQMIDGKVEKIVDPTVGTGGFLTMAINYLNKKYNSSTSSSTSTIDWTKNSDNIIGFDIDDNVRGLCTLNVLLEIGELCNNIQTRNTLNRDMVIDDEPIQADVILANEPMGLKNIKHKECCQRIRDLNIKGTKGEPLFLQLFMQSLAPNGRCAVIVPDGTLFNDLKLYRETRKHLIENFNLHKVTQLKGDFFLNTGVKTSILYFSNTGKTTSVEFCQLTRDNTDNLVETTIVTVEHDTIIKNKYSLSVDRYNFKELEKIEGLEYLKLDDICDFMPKSKRKASNGEDDGQYPFYTSSNKIRRCDFADYNDECLILGTGGNPTIHIDTHFSCSSDNFILKNTSNNCTAKYIYHYLKSNINILKQGFKGSTIKHLSKTYIKDILIPLPSLETQYEIIGRLDVLESNNQTSQKMIEDYRKIQQYYIQSMTNNHNYKIYNIGDICDTSSGEYVKKGEIVNGDFPIYGGGNASNYINRYNRENSLVISKDGVSKNCVRFIKDKFFLNHHGWTLKYKYPELQLDKYIYLWLYANQHKIYRLAKGSAQKGINRNSFYELKIIVPPLEIQTEIIEYCDNLSNTINFMEKQINLNCELMKNMMNNYLQSNVNTSLCNLDLNFE